MRDELRAEIATDVATLARDVEDRGEDTTPSQHPADVASDLTAREELVAEQQRLGRQLAGVDAALERIDAGTYGRCVECGRRIPPERLEAVPDAARCIECQRLVDGGTRG